MTSKVGAAAEAYKVGLAQLRLMVDAVEREVLDSTGSSRLITDNINFFTKSFLISLCAHLEMCVKDVVYVIAGDLDERVSAACIPSSIIDWRYSKKKGESSSGALQRFAVGMTKKEVDDLVSGNVYRTRDALALVGVDLSADKATWETWKELIQNIVTRRNNIVHRNDEASDLSFGDVRQYIDCTDAYIDFIIATCDAALPRN